MALWLAAVVLLAACSDDGGDGAQVTAEASVEALTVEDVTAPGPYAVGVATYELVDTTRPTSASGDVPGTDERRLPTEVWYPAVADAAKPDGRELLVDESGAPYPLIIFAHGLSSSRLFSPDYTRHLASHGYVVAAPDFPLTRIGTPGGVRFMDVVNQPGDVSYVVDTMLSFNETQGHLLQGAVDGERIALTGHSLGGFTALIGLYEVYGVERDERIDAGLTISASGCVYDENTETDVAIPMMFLTGSEDLIVPRAGNRRAYDLAAAPRYWVEVRGANHVRFSFADIDDAVVAQGVLNLTGRGGDATPGDGQGVDDGDRACGDAANPLGAPKLTLEEQNRELRLYATPFFDAYLRDDEASLRFLQETLPSLEGAAYEFEAE
ncbi:MAG: alpha/beta fold hydrolase [Dehalococcoidia bacterium]